MRAGTCTHSSTHPPEPGLRELRLVAKALACAATLNSGSNSLRRDGRRAVRGGRVRTGKMTQPLETSHDGYRPPTRAPQRSLVVVTDGGYRDLPVHFPHRSKLTPVAAALALLLLPAAASAATGSVTFTNANTPAGPTTTVTVSVAAGEAPYGWFGEAFDGTSPCATTVVAEEIGGSTPAWIGNDTFTGQAGTQTGTIDPASLANGDYVCAYAYISASDNPLVGSAQLTLPALAATATVHISRPSGGVLSGTATVNETGCQPTAVGLCGWDSVATIHNDTSPCPATPTGTRAGTGDGNGTDTVDDLALSAVDKARTGTITACVYLENASGQSPMLIGLDSYTFPPPPPKPKPKPAPKRNLPPIAHVQSFVSLEPLEHGFGINLIVDPPAGGCKRLKPGTVSFKFGKASGTLTPCQGNPRPQHSPQNVLLINESKFTLHAGESLLSIDPFQFVTFNQNYPLRVKYGSKTMLAGTVHIENTYTPGKRIWEYTDAFVNVCINGGYKTYSQNLRLYCTTNDSETGDTWFTRS
jgi:hypothetical protein